jgi:hypothetical protein
MGSEVTEVLQGIRRTLGVAPNQKDPVLVDTLRALVEPMRRDDPGDVRDPPVELVPKRCHLRRLFVCGQRRQVQLIIDAQGVPARAAAATAYTRSSRGLRQAGVVAWRLHSPALGG